MLRSAFFVFLSWLLSSQLVEAMPNYRHLSDDLLQSLELRYGEAAKVRVSVWRDLLDELAAQVPAEDLKHIEAANAYFNRVQWKWDIDHWGQEDYWATPIETLSTNGGDCEDFSIGKYFSLISMGMQTHKLRITYVKALEYDLAHMVLAYYPTPAAEPLILDNINQTILPASARQDLLPIYSFNGGGLWLAKSGSPLVRGDLSSSLPSWQRLQGKMKAELAN
ncbi:MAG: transglutaminase-like cysteine peptidase [Cellvibrionaceae bacterium]|nr:transglutaminase-like cysteine peptidase [Cellvibrionaceae bacterium]